MMRIAKLVFLLLVASVSGCGEPHSPKLQAPETRTDSASGEDSAPRSSSQLRMRIDGSEWVATQYITGEANALGHDRGVSISGGRLRDDSVSQLFELIILGVDGTGDFIVSSADPRSGSATLSGLDKQRSAAGTMFGFELKVKLLKWSIKDNLVEARFEGYMNAMNGDRLTITDGYFVSESTAR
jgi:hypothetical protein